MLYNILKDQWQTIEIDRIRSITQETEFSQMAELLYVMAVLHVVLFCFPKGNLWKQNYTERERETKDLDTVILCFVVVVC